MHHYHQFYVITEDLAHLMENWADSHGFKIPDEDYFYNLHLELRHKVENILNSEHKSVMVDSIPYDMIQNSLNSEVLNFVDIHNNLFAYDAVVSIDHVYGASLSVEHSMLEISRAVDENGNDAGYIPRGDNPSIKQQIKELSQSIQTVLLVDDGWWSGKTLLLIADMFMQHRIKVVGVVVGLSVKENNTPLLRSSVVSYNQFRPVLDWVCERDFFYGSPFGGRSVLGYPRHGMYYPSTFDTLNNWASLIDNGSFHSFCVNSSIQLFADIEELSNRKVLLGDLDRIPFEMKGLDDKQSFIQAMQRLARKPFAQAS